MKADNRLISWATRIQPVDRWIMTTVLLSCLMANCFTQAVHASPPQTNATTGKSASPPAASKQAPQTASLGKINVTATRQLIKTLQTVKVALNASYSDSPDQANAVVCRVRTGHGYLNSEERMGAVLECGTNSWFTWRREKCKSAMHAADCASEMDTAAFKRKGAWHSMRPLNFKQLAALRQLLKSLPAPGKGQVVVVDKSGKPVMQIKN
ncbi:MAG: hypothetical protein KGK44_05120 [Gammaproteobacteria bacterium]|nr:hypothetical protein [Gammaproteobacteria bacterium]